VPEALQGSRAASDVERGWRHLQLGDTAKAGLAFASALDRRPAFYPAMAGQGYVALATGGHAQALDAFDAALLRSQAYVPALVGRGQALVGLSRGDEAIAAFESALEADPALTGLAERVEVLRLRRVQDRIADARAAVEAGRLDEARQVYERVVALTPESAFIHRELGMVESRRGDVDSALAHLGRAVELDPLDGLSLEEIGRLHEQRQNLDAALISYQDAYDLDPRPALAARIAVLEERVRDARLPAEFRSIPERTPLTRGDLAALIGVRFEAALAAAPRRQVVMTDTRGHWAEAWIRVAAETGVMDPFENHTFRPHEAVRRVDLANVARRVALLLDSRRAELSLRPEARPPIADVSPTHLGYPAISFVVASGVMPLVDGRRFQVSLAVTGAEAVTVVERLKALPAPGR
jgi:tetratricopeptide (TPR) repeat protein